MKYRDSGQENDSKLPLAPMLTKAQLQTNDEMQELYKSAAGLSVSPNNLLLNRASAVITESEVFPFSMLNEFQKANYISALAVVGRYAEAAKLSEDGEYYRKVNEAINRDDSETCSCSDTETAQMVDGRAQKVTISRFFKRAKVYSLKHKEWKHLFECSKCGFQNVK